VTARLGTAGRSIGRRSSAPPEASRGQNTGLMPPTAMHATLDVHDTPASVLPKAEGGTSWMAQLVPFQCSANVPPDWPMTWKYPTATQNFGDGQDTLRR
jgi:hypothetical protein